MLTSSDWDARAAISGCVVSTWQGYVWRNHANHRSALDAAGSLRISGRYNRGMDQFTSSECWEVLYTSLGRDTALAELVRHVGPETAYRLKSRRLTRLQVELSHVMDCRDLDQLGVPPDDVFHDTDYSVGQAIAGAAVELGVEAMLVPSATLLGDNLIIFPANRNAASRLRIVDYVDPRLVVERPR